MVTGAGQSSLTLAQWTCQEPVSSLSFAASKAEHLLAVGTDTSATILQVDIPNEVDLPNTEREFNCQALTVYPCPSRVTAIAWSFDTEHSQETGKHHWRLAVACANHLIIAFVSKGATFDANALPQRHLYPGHHDYINAIAFSPIVGEESLFASVSDDSTCRVRRIGTAGDLYQFSLSSPGVSVAWHPLDATKLFVAEQCGSVRIIDLMTRQVSLTLHSNVHPLRSFELNYSEPFRLGAVTSKKWVTWNLQAPSKQLTGPEKVGDVPTETGCLFRWAHHNKLVFAVGSSSGEISFHKLHHENATQTQKNPLPSVDLSWHASQPLCVVAADKTLYFWSVFV